MAKSIVDILVSKGILDLTEASQIKKSAKEKDLLPEDVLYSRGITETDVAEAKSILSGYPVKYLQGLEVPFEMLKDIPEESAKHYQIIPLGRREGYIEIGVLSPDDIDTQEAIKFISSRVNLPARIFIVTPSDFGKILTEYKSLSGEVTRALGEFEKEYEKLGAEIKLPKKGSARIVEDAPVTKMMGVILRHAVEGRASDVHIEPVKNNLRVRFRVDGVLHTSLTLPSDTHSAIVTRIKVMTDLKLDETRVPQDGRFSARILERDIDFRVSTLPTSFGEKVVMRILDPATGIKELADLGFEGRNLEMVHESIQKPFGMILLTGPTGSGKSTTLYAMLQLLNEERSNIISLEDPIEYYIDGVNQSQIRPDIGYDFATGLRHILRQDPDIIMVGEIRDKETAALAIHAALTGHLVLSTLHTNNAVGVIPRLLDMGVDPFLIPSTLILAIAQRLTRRLCADSRKKMPITGRVKEIIQSEIDSMPEKLQGTVKGDLLGEIYQSKISPTCPKGTRGRMGIFESLIMTPQLEQIIISGPSEQKISEEAKRQGMITMRQDGILKVLKGVIGLEELMEVV